MAATFDTLMGHCLVDLPGAPDLLVTAALSASARVLCLEASCWEEAQDITLESGQPDYALFPPTGGTVRHVKAVLLNGRALLPIDQQTILDTAPGLLEQVGEPTHYFMRGEMDIRLLPMPHADLHGKAAIAQVAYVPAFDSASLPSVLVERYAEALIAGAKARMMAMPGQTWSNPQFAMLYQSQFTESVTRARIEQMHSYSRGDLRVKARRFQ